MRLKKIIKASFSSPLEQREDSRAFGALVEGSIREKWHEICKRVRAKNLGEGGRRTIYDLAFEYKGWEFGFDIRSKDTESGKYSDGGVCSVKNLLDHLGKR